MARAALVGRLGAAAWLSSRVLLAGPGAPVSDVQAPPTRDERDESDEALPPPPSVSPSPAQESSAPKPAPAPSPAPTRAPEDPRAPERAPTPSAVAPEPAPFSAAVASPDSSLPRPLTSSESTPPTTSMDQTEPSPKAADPDLFATHPWSFDITLGGGTPTGTFGVSLDYHLTPSFSLGGGVGVGSGPSSGAATQPHAGIFARVRPARDHKNALVLEGALSGGSYKQGVVFSGTQVDGAEVSTATAFFLQGAVGWEKRSEKGLLVRLTAGVAYLLNPGSLRCVPKSTYPLGTQPSSSPCDAFPGSPKSDVAPTIAFTLGKAF